MIMERDEGRQGLLDLAWAAGLFEGEGCVGLQKKPGGRHLVLLQVASTDRDVLERFMAITGTGTLFARKKEKSHHKQCWVWKVTGAKALAIVTNPAFYQQLGERRKKKVDEVVLFVDSLPPTGRKTYG